MSSQAILNIFEETGALLEGHFVLTSGRHSASYFQCARVLQYPRHLSNFAAQIAEHFKNQELDTVISPAVGGIVIGTEVGRQLDVKTIFAERKDGKMTIRRGFEIAPGEKILVVEDVITTGGSVKEVMALCTSMGGEIIGVGVVVDRSNGTASLHNNQFAVTEQEAVSYAPEDVPEDLMKIPVQKPGSRHLTK